MDRCCEVAAYHAPKYPKYAMKAGRLSWSKKFKSPQVDHRGSNLEQLQRKFLISSPTTASRRRTRSTTFGRYSRNTGRSCRRMATIRQDRRLTWRREPRVL